MTMTLGKRYECTQCSSELVCTRAGDGELACCGQPMGLKHMQPLPSSD